jgi:cytochrome c553
VKKLLLILLLTILPIQYSWSMAAVYCQHEPGKVSHFGHHTHQHQTQADDGATDSGKSSKVHTDCEVCHHAVQASAPAADGMALAQIVSVHAPPLPSQYLSYISEGPPRPNWTLVA